MNDNDVQESGISTSNESAKSKIRRMALAYTLAVSALLGIGVYFVFNFNKVHEDLDTDIGEYYDENQGDSIKVNGWATQDQFDYWQKATFTIPAYDGIPLPFKRSIVKIFLDNKYLTNETNNQHFFTKIKDRATQVISYGPFTGHGETEMAFLLEKFDFASSAMFIISERGNILYWKDLPNELPTLKRIEKGTLVYMNSMDLVPAPHDGIVRESQLNKYVILYNKTTKVFEEFYQYTPSDLKDQDVLDEEDYSNNQVVDSALVSSH